MLLDACSPPFLLLLGVFPPPLPGVDFLGGRLHHGVVGLVLVAGAVGAGGHLPVVPVVVDEFLRVERQPRAPSAAVVGVVAPTPRYDAVPAECYAAIVVGGALLDRVTPPLRPLLVGKIFPVATLSFFPLVGDGVPLVVIFPVGDGALQVVIFLFGRPAPAGDEAPRLVNPPVGGGVFRVVIPPVDGEAPEVVISLVVPPVVAEER